MTLDMRRLAVIGFLLFMVGAGINTNAHGASTELAGTSLIGLGVLLAAAVCVRSVRR